jgi:cold shock CspA family protein
MSMNRVRAGATVRNKNKGDTMQTPVQIDFQGLDVNPEIRRVIDARLKQFEDRFGRITAGRIMLKAPGGHHRTGGQYEITVRLALPDGREVNIGRTPLKDERYADLNFAINDAFNRARRQLQDQVRKLQGQVKQHSGPAVGTVVELDPLGEFGFIAAGDGREIYFHRNSVLENGFAQLTVGAHVSFAEETGDKGPQASTVKVMAKHSLKL